MFKFSSKMKDFPENSEWLNTDKPLSLNSNLKGHIVVLDFWTYSCILCKQILSDLKFLEEKFENDPVIFISVHSAKYPNEEISQNINSAVARYEIQHPVIIDKDRTIWNDFHINKWPTILIIDSKGNVVYNQSGEDQKKILEEVIKNLLQQSREKKELTPLKTKIKNTFQKPNFTLSFPGKIALRDNIIVISDTNHNRILVAELNGLTADILYEIGTGIAGYTNGTLEEAEFDHPQGVVIIEEMIFVADTENHSIRKIDLQKRTVKTIAGTGRKGWGTTSKAKGIKVSLNTPWDLLISENYLYIAMAGSHQIWRMNILDEEIEPYAGTSQENIIDGPRKQAQLAQPTGLAASKDEIFFIDSEGSALRKIDLHIGEVKTLAGKGFFVFGNKDGLFDNALLQHPLGIDIYKEKIFIADTYNHAIKIANLEEEKISTIISTNDQKTCLLYTEKIIPTDWLSLFEPNDIKYSQEFLFIADTNNHLIRRFDLNKQILEDVIIDFRNIDKEMKK
ncbi:MAG: hypothetical protein EAX90_09570 [Candidatus Heimdallarchaeota archaeon]|nr:hypothetical protein [Candidatus Heimdallarchaeota archaeon]